MNKQTKKEIIIYVSIFLLIIIIRTFIVTPIRVNGDSMNPTLKDGEIMILNKIGYSINGVERFDIVVVDYNGDKLIKRVIGLPGETVEYKDDTLYINGKKIEENFKKNGKTNDYSIIETGYKTIPKDKYFVVGDNRVNSADSRVIGLVDKDQILGKANFVLLPFSKFGFVE